MTIRLVDAKQGKVVFCAETREWSPTLEIFVAEGLNSLTKPANIRRLTHNEVMDSNAVFSPDATRVAFSRSLNPDGFGFPHGLFVVPIETGSGELRFALELRQVSVTDWAPANRILFHGREPKGEYSQIFSIRGDGNGLCKLTKDESQNMNARWLPPLK
jgi:Tol biopolymer transport system component